MRIYVSHSTGFDFRRELYIPLQQSTLSQSHTLILPHMASDVPYSTKALFEKKQCDVVLAEVSYPSTGQGIELGWADLFGIRIVCVSKKGAKVSSSLRAVAKDFIEYENMGDVVRQLEEIL